MTDFSQTENTLSSDTIEIFGDESGNPGDDVFALGLLVLPSRKKPEFLAEIEELRKSHNVNWTAHYSEINRRRSPYCRGLVNLFIRLPYLRFIVNVFPKTTFRVFERQPEQIISPYEKAYCWTYTQIVGAAMRIPCAKALLYAHRKDKLRDDRFINGIKSVDNRIKDVQEVPARGWDGIQMCDILLGSFCGGIRQTNSNADKIDLQKHLMKKLRLKRHQELNSFTRTKFRTWFFR